VPGVLGQTGRKKFQTPFEKEGFSGIKAPFSMKIHLTLFF
jgi:hypothetical protein